MRYDKIKNYLKSGYTVKQSILVSSTIDRQVIRRLRMSIPIQWPYEQIIINWWYSGTHWKWFSLWEVADSRSCESTTSERFTAEVLQNMKIKIKTLKQWICDKEHSHYTIHKCL